MLCAGYLSFFRGVISCFYLFFVDYFLAVGAGGICRSGFFLSPYRLGVVQDELIDTACIFELKPKTGGNLSGY